MDRPPEDAARRDPARGPAPRTDGQRTLAPPGGRTGSDRRYDPAALELVLAETRGRATTTQELVLETLRRGILEGALPPGTKLRQEELARTFGTSRLPVREAIWVLEREGLLTSRPNRSVIVSALEVDEIVEIYDLRVLLECHAVRLAIPLLTEYDVQELRALHDAMMVAEDPDLLVIARDRFYLRLFAISGRPRLVTLIQRLRQEIWRSFHGNPPSHPAFHARFLELLLAGDADGAAAELANHYAKVSAMLRRSLRAGTPPNMRDSR
jgi:DNA-binding GntR family transcriptional regulator